MKFPKKSSIYSTFKILQSLTKVNQFNFAKTSRYHKRISFINSNFFVKHLSLLQFYWAHCKLDMSLVKGENLFPKTFALSRLRSKSSSFSNNFSIASRLPLYSNLFLSQSPRRYFSSKTLKEKSLYCYFWSRLPERQYLLRRHRT